MRGTSSACSQHSLFTVTVSAIHSPEILWTQAWWKCLNPVPQCLCAKLFVQLYGLRPQQQWGCWTAMLDSWNLPCILLSISLAKTLGGIEEMREINCMRERNKEIFWSSPTNRTTIWWFSGGKPWSMLNHLVSRPSLAHNCIHRSALSPCPKLVFDVKFHSSPLFAFLQICNNLILWTLIWS
jgi:hypothetical protein